MSRHYADLPEDVKSAFEDVLCIEDPVARGAAFESLCARHREWEAPLRGEYDAVAVRPAPSAADSTGRLLAAAARSMEVHGTVPDTLGPYRVLREIGRGGMGVVLEGEDTRELRRRVALKMIRPDRRQWVHWLRNEPHLLAALNHDAIARVYEVQLDGDVPYFAMELVDGEPIHAFCARHRVPVRDRVALVRDVCAGIEHAHLKGVFHRDLSPANVLVVQDGKRHGPKIIDFGLGRADGVAAAEGSEALDDRISGFGTPGFRAPEQAAGDVAAIDARTDTYGLGALLYYLLTDEPPPEAASADGGERGLLRPSARVADDPRRARALRGDLDRVTAKALAADPAERYQSAAALAEDLDRTLSGHPVTAGPRTRTYVVGKWLARNAVLATAAALVLAATAVGGTLATLGLVEAVTKNRQFRLARFSLELEDFVSAFAGLSPDPETWSDGWSRAAEAAPLFPSRLAEMERALEEVRETRRTLAQRLAGVGLVGGRDVGGDGAGAGDAAAALQRELASVRRAAALAAVGGRGLEPVDADAFARTIRGEELASLNAWAAARVGPTTREVRRIWGEERMALAVCEHVVATVREEREKASLLTRWTWEGPLTSALSTLAWAHAWNGAVDEARAVSAEVAERLGRPRADYQRSRRDLETLCRHLESGGRFLADRLEADLAVLAADRALRAEPLFEASIDRFLFRTIVAFERSLSALRRPGGGALWNAEQTLRWAQAVEGLTLKEWDGLPSWSTARAEIAREPAYAAAPIDLVPQTGLVPLGRNPRTGLWEFYHLRSAWDPRGAMRFEDVEVPRLGEDGTLEVTHRTGIVFVLVPGGTLTVRDETPDAVPETVRLDPFFVARHELTQAQWVRLSADGVDPSQFPPGTDFFGVDGETTSTHPVEQVSWTMADELLRRFGLALPTEAQWEYAARAGTTTKWWTGATLDTVRGAGNLFDERTRLTRMPYPFERVPWDDKWSIHAPVGSYAPNPWGLFDTIGNVDEWCRDAFDAYFESAARPRDGLRTPGTNNRVRRGGAFATAPEHSAADFRAGNPPGTRENRLGVRPVRILARRGDGEQG